MTKSQSPVTRDPRPETSDKKPETSHQRPDASDKHETAEAIRMPNSVPESGYPEQGDDHSSKDADC